MRPTPANGAQSAITGVVQRFNRWRGNRRALLTLSHFSDAALADIGLTRTAIRDAVRYDRP